MRRNVKRRRPWPPDRSKTVFRDRFLWLPVQAENRETGELEWRWLERATYVVKVVHWENNITGVATRWSFEPVEWVDSGEQEREIGRDKLDAYYLLRYRAWETGDSELKKQVKQMQRGISSLLH